MWILLRRFLYHVEQARLHLLAVDDELATKYFVAAVLRVYLCETEDFAVCERSAQLLLHVVQIVNLGWRECQTFLFVIFFKVLHMLDRLRLALHGEHFLVQPLIHALKHGVVLGVLVGNGEVLLDALDAFEIHVLCNLYRIGAPWCYHLATRTNEESLYRRLCFACRCQQFCTAVKPA